MVTDEQFISIIKDSYSVSDALRKMGVQPRGANYDTVYKNVERLNLDISHFTGKRWAKGVQRTEYNKDISLYLNNVAPCKSHTLKLRLIKEGYMEAKCSVCQQKEWMDKPIPIELDHINGDCKDNTLENLRIICPNCHAQTKNYKAKNRRDRGKGITYCSFCGKQKTKRAKCCLDCLHKVPRKTAINWPSNEELEEMMKTMTIPAIARKINQNISSLRDHIKRTKIGSGANRTLVMAF